MATERISLSRGITAELLNDEDAERLKNKYSILSDGVLRVNPGGWIFPGKYYQHARNILDFEYSEKDILVMTFPKSGTTWMQEICWNLLHNPDQNNPLAHLSSDFRCILLEICFVFSVTGAPIQKFVDKYINLFDKVYPGYRTEMENEDPFAILYGMYRDRPGPRVAKIHHSISLLPSNILDKTKVVYLARNMYDVVNSYYHFFRLNLTAGLGETTLDQFIDDFVAEKLVFCPYYKHMKDAWDQRHNPNLLFLFYEDLKRDNVNQIEKINQFLGTGRTADQIERVSKFTSFKSLKERFKNNEPTSYNFFQLDTHSKEVEGTEDGSFFRKGEIDDWKNYFSESQKKKLEDYAERNLPMFGEDFRYNQLNY